MTLGGWITDECEGGGGRGWVGARRGERLEGMRGLILTESWKKAGVGTGVLGNSGMRGDEGGGGG